MSNSSSKGNFHQRKRIKKTSYEAVKPSNRKIPLKVRNDVKTNQDDGMIRLNKYIANSGICSRREADELIISGLISVNDKVVTELGVKISSNDSIKYDGKKLKPENKIYILLNKPKDYITTVEDPHAKQTVLDLIKGACKERVYPVGRLDRNTTGLLLLTNDGDLTKKLTHPSFHKLKIYQVTLNKPLKPSDLDKIASGLTLEDGLIKADSISYVDSSDKKLVGIEIHSGKNRIVKRIFEHFDYKVIKLDRVYFAGLTKKGLQRGKWRFLTEQEITMLRMSAYK